MNKYQKEKSREIRDIMRTDPWRRMTYKEAKRKWRKGIRAFKVGDAWIAKDLARYGLSRRQIMEIGRVWYKFLKYCAARNLGFTCQNQPYLHCLELRFNGWSADNKKYSISYKVSYFDIRQYRGNIMEFVDYILYEVNRRVQEFVFPSTIKPSPMSLDLDRRMLFSDAKLMRPEAVFGKIVTREDL